MTRKTSAGRTTTGMPRIPEVESLPCPRGGTHRLANSAQRGGLVTACVGCGASWSELDSAARTPNRKKAS